MPTVHYYPRKFFRLRGVAPPMRLAPRPGRAPRGWNGAYPLLRPVGGAGVTPSPAGKKRARADAPAPTEEADGEVDPIEVGELQSGHFPATRGAVPRRRREKMRRLLSDTSAARAPLEMADQSLDESSKEGMEPSHEGMELGQQRVDTLEGQPIDSDEGDRELAIEREGAAEEAAGEADGTSVDQGEGGENVRPQKPSAANSHGHGSQGGQRVEIERVVNLRGRPRPEGRLGDNATISSQQEWDAPISSLEEEVEKDLGLGDLDPALVLQRKLDRELGVGDCDPRRMFQRELERDLGVPVGGIVGTSAQVGRPELRRFITPDTSRSPSKRGPPDASLAVAGDAGGTAHGQALAVGFSAHFLQNKRDEEVRLLVDSAASMREKTREETGLCAPRSLASVLEQALEMGFDVRYLASKSLDEAKALILYAASAATPLRRNSSLPGLTGEAEKPPADAPVPMNVGKPGPLMPDETDYSHSVNPSGGGIVSSHERALNLGFTAEFLATKTKAEAQVLLDSIASISLRTKQMSGHSASLNLASTVEYALDLGYALCFLANQSEEEIEQYVTSRVEKIEAERAIASKGTNVTLSDRESDVDDDEELGADDEDSDAGENDDAEDEAEAEVQSDTNDEGSVQDEEDEEDSQSDRVDEGDISSDGAESSDEEDTISIVSSGEEQSMIGESAVADESSGDESDDVDGVVRVGLPLGMRRSSSLSSLTRERTVSSSSKASRFKSWMGRKQSKPVKPKPQVKHRAANEEIFRQHVEALKAYRAKYGDYLVPSTYPILGRWVRTVRGCHHNPEAKRSWALTEDRREMLDEIGFEWERPAFRSHAYKTRARNITRAAVTMQSINDYNASLQQPIRIAPVEGSDPKATVAKQIAEHVINTEQHGQANQIDEKYYAQGIAAGVEEVDLFNAFEEIGREGSLSLSLENQGAQDRKRKWSTVEDGTVESGLTLVRSPRQPDEVFGEWLADRKQNWRQQQLRQWKTKIASAEGGASLSTRPESIEEFGHWLAVRKAIWKEKQRRKLRMVQVLVVDIADKRPPVVKKKAKRARKSSSSPEIDYGTCGVRYRSGMWGVEVSVRSKLRYVGKFPSQENAALANRVFRDRVTAIVTPDQTPDEVNEAVKLARWTALQAVARESSEEGQSTSKNDQRSQPKEAVTQREGLEDEDQQKMQPVAPGISQRSWGKWEVAPYLYGKKRYIGSFDSLSQAHKANEVVREQLMTAGDGPRPSDEDIEQAVKKARDAARPKDSSTQKRKQSMASKAVSQKSAKTSSSSAVNSNPSGVRRAPSGRWEVRFRHGGTIQVHIGTFETKDDAILANDMARRILLTECNGADPSSEEIKRAVIKAREKVWEAVRKLNDEDDEPPTEEDELAILLKWDEFGASSGPHLDQLQSKEGFVGWLAMRKERWRRQSGRVLKPKPIATDPKLQRKSTTTSSDGEDDEPPTEEDKLAILLKWDESGAWSGPHLPVSHSQSQEGFATWLAARKERWRGQSGRVLKPHTTKQRPEEHRCSYNCGAPFDLAPKECCTLNCSGLVHQICQQFYLRSHGKQVGVDDELRCKECSVWTESESQSKQGDSIEDKESTSPLLVLGANLPAGPAINDANTDDATATDSEDSRAVRVAKARAARRRRRLQLIARAAVADSRRATFARGREILAEEFARTFCPAAFVEATFEPAFAMMVEASEVEAGKAQESPVP